MADTAPAKEKTRAPARTVALLPTAGPAWTAFTPPDPVPPSSAPSLTPPTPTPAAESLPTEWPTPADLAPDPGEPDQAQLDAGEQSTGEPDTEPLEVEGPEAGQPDAGLPDDAGAAPATPDLTEPVDVQNVPAVSFEAPSPPETAPAEVAPQAEQPAPEAAPAPGQAVEAAPAEAPPGEMVAEEMPAEEVALHMPPAPKEPSPATQARLSTVVGGVRGTATAAATMPDPDTTTEAARAAVTEPPEETSARAEAALTEALGERPAPSPEILKLCADIRLAIRARRPVDEDHLVKAEPEKMAAEAGQSLNTAVEGDASRVSGEYDAMSTPPEGTPQQTAQPITPPTPAVPAPGVDAAAAVPDPIPAENVSLDQDRADLDQRIADSGMERPASEPLREPPFSTIREGQAELGEMAAERPAQVLAAQDEALGAARAGMADLQTRAVAALTAARAGTVAGVGERQSGMVGTEEQTRESVSKQAGQFFDEAQTQVNALLTPLTQTAMQTWRAGVERHSTEFKQTLERVARWIEERHEGVGGTLLAGWDALTGLPGWVVEEYDRAERLFGDRICDLLLEISTDVESVIAAAEAIIEDARRRIDELFAALPEELREWAEGERAGFAQRLDGLHAQVTETRDGFTRDLTREAVTTVSAVQREVETLREAAGGLIGRVISAIEAFLDDPVRAIINGLLTLVGIPPAAFWALVEKLAQVIGDIADDPRRFGNNLVAALAQGFRQFFDHFGTHLLQGFFDWLFRGLGSVGVQLPKDFSISSIVTFALQLMGLSWPNIRQILVRHIGEKSVALIEQAWSLVSALIQRGPAGLLDMLREKLDPATLFQQILDAAISYVTETLVEQASVRLLALLTPAGAVLQAIELIYKVLKWVFENAASIFKLVETVVNGAADLLAGNIGGMATAVEFALAALIPIVIDLLAGMVGLGDLPERVVEVIKKFQAYVLRIVDSVIEWLVKQGRALLSALGIGEEKPKAGGDAGDQEPGTSITFTAAGESHRHWVEVSGGRGELLVASSRKRLVDKLAEWTAEAPAKFAGDKPKLDQARELLEHAHTEVKLAEGSMDFLASREAAEKLPAHPGGKIEPLPDDALERQQQILARLLNQLFELFGAPGGDKLPEIAKLLPGFGQQFVDAAQDGWWQSQISRPKIANPAETDLFQRDVLAGVEKDALAYTDQQSTHEALLPYFRLGEGERKVDSQAFDHYAFHAYTPDPPHFVRRQFLAHLGAEAARALKAAGQAVVTPGFDPHVHAELGSIAFDPDKRPYGRFTPFVGGVLHPDLKTAVENAGGLLPFFEALINDPTGGPMTWEQFSAIWRSGGAGPQWVKSEWRGLEPSHHEWIPVDYIRNVLEHAIELAGQKNIRRALDWLLVLNEFRSPTNYVMWSIGEIIGYDYRQGEPPRPIIKPGLGAHVGTGSKPGEPKRSAATVGSKAFHDILRRYVSDARAYDASPKELVEVLLVDLRTELLWDGTTDYFTPKELDEWVGMDIFVTDVGWVSGMTYRQLAVHQREQVAKVEADFRKLLGKLS
ncbi:hypothetical protein [Nonomuraea endophytica]|uniref:hypothetical protein n=1 Tax=Nonomuraea endophytica TaxID=714136 RepID=UPI0037CC2C07